MKLSDLFERIRELLPNPPKKEEGVLPVPLDPITEAYLLDLARNRKKALRLLGLAYFRVIPMETLQVRMDKRAIQWMEVIKKERVVNETLRETVERCLKSVNVRSSELDYLLVLRCYKGIIGDKEFESILANHENHILETKNKFYWGHKDTVEFFGARNISHELKFNDMGPIITGHLTFVDDLSKDGKLKLEIRIDLVGQRKGEYIWKISINLPSGYTAFCVTLPFQGASETIWGNGELQFRRGWTLENKLADEPILICLTELDPRGEKYKNDFYRFNLPKIP